MEEEAKPIKSADLIRIFFVAIVAAGVGFHFWETVSFVKIFIVGATLLGGYPIFKKSFSALIERHMTMELSMTIAVVAALSIGEFFTALVIIFFVLVAEILEDLTVRSGRNAIQELLDLLPQKAFVHWEGRVQERSVALLQIGDIVVIKPGSRLPVDGVVIKGISFVDQSSITGESMPVEKVEGAHVYAGTINQSGFLEVRTLEIGQNTAFGKIIAAVERAEQSRAPIQKTADRFSGYLVYFAVGCAGITYLLTRDMRSTISVIIVAGACGVAAGTPLAILGAIGQAARKGSIIKGGIYLETLGKIDVILLDKTGTLTFGSPEVVQMQMAPGVSEQTLLEAAAIAERPSEHPLGKAILKKAFNQSLKIADTEGFAYTPGKGIVCHSGGEEIVAGNKGLFSEKRIQITDIQPKSPNSFSEVHVARAGRYLGVIRILDVLRPEATQAISELRKMNIHTVLLTGDKKDIADSVGGTLGVDEIQSELLPEQKIEQVRLLLGKGLRVAMLGDGINDAPALMQASVGIAMGSGTDVAKESANIVLLGDDLLKFVETVKIARRCHRIILFNFLGTLLVDGVGIGLAAFGFLTPILAAFIHVSSELAFIMNSTRLLSHRSKD